MTASVWLPPGLFMTAIGVVMSFVSWRIFCMARATWSLLPPASEDVMNSVTLPGRQGWLQAALAERNSSAEVQTTVRAIRSSFIALLPFLSSNVGESRENSSRCRRAPRASAIQARFRPDNGMIPVGRAGSDLLSSLEHSPSGGGPHEIPQERSQGIREKGPARRVDRAADEFHGR